MGSRPVRELFPWGFHIICRQRITGFVRASRRVGRRFAFGWADAPVCRSVADCVRAGFALAVDLLDLHQSPFRASFAFLPPRRDGKRPGPPYAGASEFLRRRSAPTTLPAAGSPVGLEASRAQAGLRAGPACGRLKRSSAGARLWQRGPRRGASLSPRRRGRLSLHHCRCARRRGASARAGRRAAPGRERRRTAVPIAPCPCEFCELRWPRRTPSTLRCSRSTPS